MIIKITKKIFYKFKRFFSDFFLLVTIGKFPSSVHIQSPHETLNKCKKIIIDKIPGAYLRFGDGDVNLLNGEDELLQTSNPKLKKEMRESFSLSGDGVIKGLMLHSKLFGAYPGMKPGIHLTDDDWAIKFLRRCYKYFIGEKIYSHVALSYLAVFDRNYTLDFLRFLKNLNPIFVGNEKIEKTVLFKLFGDCLSIDTPAKGSYSKIDEIETSLLRLINNSREDYVVVVVAMGCSGRVLQKRILKNTNKKVFLFDFGSLLDAFCGWNTRAWMDLSGVSSDYFIKLINEV